MAAGHRIYSYLECAMAASKTAKRNASHMKKVKDRKLRASGRLKQIVRRKQKIRLKKR